MSKLKISIITVSLNSQSTIRQTIESVRSQSYKNIEYILIDGGSTDWTLEIINDLIDNIDYFKTENDNGIYDAMNKGISIASGDIIGILNSDDFYDNPNVIEDVVRIFESKKCDSLYGDLVYVKASNALDVVRYWQSGNFKREKLKNGWTLPHPTFFVKKSIYNKYGLYNTKLKTAADYEMIIRLLFKHNISVEYLPKILVHMRTGGISNASLKHRFIANKEDGLAWKFNHLYQPMFVRIQKPFQKIVQFFKKPIS